MFKHLKQGRIFEIKENGHIVVVKCKGQLIHIQRDMYHPIVCYGDQFRWSLQSDKLSLIPDVGSKVVIELFSDESQTLHLRWTTLSQLLQTVGGSIQRE